VPHGLVEALIAGAILECVYQVCMERGGGWTREPGSFLGSWLLTSAPRLLWASASNLRTSPGTYALWWGGALESETGCRGCLLFVLLLPYSGKGGAGQELDAEAQRGD
jgi:hypothetical protein